MSYCFYCMKEKGGAHFCPYCGQPDSRDAQSHHLHPGTILSGKYLVGYAIGEGGFGITYVGRDTTLDIKVAIKEYYPNGCVNRNTVVSPQVATTSEKQIERFQKGKNDFLYEARRLARFLKLPGVVGVRDYFEANGTAYIIMDYLEGETLSDYLKRAGTMPAQRAFELMLPVVNALKAVHAQGIIHRDISPDNIMYCPDGTLVLMDFGSARFFANSEKEMSVMLKQGYAPEEQYRKSGDQGPWTDVYGVCATLYKCITGKRPADALDRLREDPIRRPGEMGAAITPACESVLMRGLAVYKENRIQDMNELEAQMKQALSGRITPQPAPTANAETLYDNRMQPPAEVQQPVRPQQDLTYGDAFGASGSRTPQPAQEKKKKNAAVPVAIALIAVFAVLAIAAIVVFGFILNNGGGKTEPTAATEVTEAPTETPTDAPTDAPTEPKITLDSYTDMRFSAVEDQLEGQGILVKKQEAYSDTVSEGYIISQSPQAGTEVSKGDTVTLTVSKGSEPTEAPTEAPTLPPIDSSMISFEKASASSELAPQKSFTYYATNMLKHDSSCWCEGVSGVGIGEYALLEINHKRTLHGICIVNGYAGTEEQYRYNGKVTWLRLEFSEGKTLTVPVEVKSVADRQEAQYIDFDEPIDSDYVGITILDAVEGEKFDDTCITYICAY